MLSDILRNLTCNDIKSNVGGWTRSSKMMSEVPPTEGGSILLKKNPFFDLYVPSYIDGEFYSPGKREGLSSLKFSRRNLFLVRGKAGNLQCREAFREFLTTYGGFSLRMAKIISSRSKGVLERIESQIFGLFDSLLLAFPESFKDPVKRNLYRPIVTKCYKIGCFNTDSITSDWKKFINFFWSRVSNTFTVETPVLDKYNPFRFLLEIKEINLLFNNRIVCKRDAEQVAHLVSSRQLVSGGSSTTIRALDKFEANVSKIYPLPEGEGSRIFKSAYKVGKKCRNFLGAQLPERSTHISLSGAGDCDYTVKDGGRLTAILNAIRPRLTSLPDEDRVIQLPFGIKLNEEKYIQRWRTWCRAERLDIPYEFEELQTGNPKHWSDDRRAGFDEAIGLQIYVCALMDAQDEGFLTPYGVLRKDYKPPKCRITVVPEPGGKSRIVSITKWWVIILQPSRTFP